MRRHVLWASLFVLAASGGVAPLASPQTQELAMRGPRFVAAWKPSAEAVDARNAVVLRRRVSLDLTNATADEALKEITRQADLEISYSKVILPTSRSVSLHAREITVAAALTEVLLDAGVDIAVARGGHMALVKRPTSAVGLLADSGVVSGRVTDKATGAPVVGATVAIVGTLHSATTDSDGHYRIADVPPGTYRVSARYIGYAPAVTSIAIAGIDAAVDFWLVKSAQKLDELVTVTPGGLETEVKALPSPVTVVTAEEINAQAPRTVQQIFRQVVPGAVSWDETSRPASASFSVRGASTLNPGSNVSQTKVFVDGIQVANEGANLIDPKSIDRIEVIRGPQAAAVYGSDAMGGVLQIFTKRGVAGSPKVQGEVGYGFAETPYTSPQGGVRQNYSISVRGGAPDVTYNVGASYWRLGEWVPPRNEISDQSSPSVFGGVRYAQGMLSLDVSGRYGIVNVGGALNPELLTSGFVDFSQPQLNTQVNSSTSLAARMVVTPLAGWSHAVTAGFDDWELRGSGLQPRFTTPSDSLVSLSVVSESRRWIGYATTLEFQPAGLVSGSITAGFDHSSKPTLSVFAPGVSPQDPSLPSALAYRLSTNNTGYYMQGQLGFRSALFLTGGLRVEQNTNFGDSLGTPVSPRVGASYVHDFGRATVKARGSWGQAIRPPDPALKLTLGPGVIPNPRLAPERQRGWDAGFDLQLGTRWSLGVTYYDQLAENLIQFVTLQFQPTILNQFQNVGRVTNRGVEVEASARTAWLQVRGSYAFSQARIDDLGPNYSGDLVVGEQARLAPKHTAGLFFTATPRTGTTVTAGLAYVGSYSQLDFLALFRCLGGTGTCPPDFRFARNYPDFAKLNAGLTQHLGGGLSALLQVDNLTNTSAAESGNLFPVMGRITTVGLRFGN